MRVAPAIELSDDDKRALTRWSRGKRTEARLVVRAKIVLLAAAGARNIEIAERLGITKDTVGRWRTRFAELGLDGIRKDLPRGGRDRPCG